MNITHWITPRTMQRIRLRYELMQAMNRLEGGFFKLKVNNIAAAIINEQLHPAIRIDWDQVGRREP